MPILFEILDKKEPINNILSTLALNPEYIVYFVDRKRIDERQIANLLSVLRSYSKALCRIVPLNMEKLEEIQKEIQDTINSYSHQDICVDVAGGDDQILALAAYICGQRNLTLVFHDKQNKNLIKMKNGIYSKPISIDYSVDVGTTFEMMGGELSRNGHVDPANLDEKTLKLIPDVFHVYMKWRTEWSRFVNYLQHINTRDIYKTKNNELVRNVPEGVYISGKYVKVNSAILHDLWSAGALLDLQSTMGRFKFSYANQVIMKLLSDAGAWLEVYLYSLLKQSSRFDSIEINAVVSWDNDEDNDDVINEIDIVAISGLNRYFISCKTGIPTNDAVNEIGIIAKRFGGQYSHPILATTCNMSKTAPAVLRRANEMGILVIDEKQLLSNQVIDIITGNLIV